jgi:hypothetical protein
VDTCGHLWRFERECAEHRSRYALKHEIRINRIKKRRVSRGIDDAKEDVGGRGGGRTVVVCKSGSYSPSLDHESKVFDRELKRSIQSNVKWIVIKADEQDSDLISLEQSKHAPTRVGFKCFELESCE